jgi:enoyl-CoA hydratase/carnithine racemase
MEFETITIDRQDAVWLLTLDRQDRLNAMNQKMLSELETACDVIEGGLLLSCSHFDWCR